MRPDRTAASRRASCSVIGGGFAGLSAAVALADAGVDVHLFEARPTLGGRANAFRDPVTGDRIDNGQHILAGCYTETLAFLARLGTRRLLHRPSTLRVPMIDTRGWRTELLCPALPPPLNLLAGVLAWDALTWRDRWAIMRIGGALRGLAPVRADETVAAWLARHHQSPRLCALFWEPLALAALNQPIDVAAAEMFVAVTSRMFSGDPEAAAILVPGVPLDDLYVTPALSVLSSAGASVTTHAKARLLTEDGRAIGVRAGDHTVATDAVIAAVPWHALGELWDTPPPALAGVAAAAAALPSAPIVTVNVWFERWQSPEAMLGLPGRAFQWAFDRRHYVGRGQSHLSLVSSGADAICEQSNADLVQLAIDELQGALPEVRQARVRHASVIRERRATFSLAPGGPRRPDTVTPVPGFFLAGDWIDTGLPATIESAVVSGHRAARAVLAAIA